MLEYRILYTKNGEEKVSPFYFDNIHEARRSRQIYKENGAVNVIILVRRPEDNIHV